MSLKAVTPPDSAYASDSADSAVSTCFGSTLSCLLMTLQDEWQLLDDSEYEESDQEVAIRIAKHDLVTAPIFTKGALEHLTTRVDNLSTQYGVLGKVVAIQ